MKKKQLHLKSCLPLLALSTVFWSGSLANAHSARVQDNRPVHDNDTTRQELARFDQFLDNHREIAEQLRKDPSLVNNEEYVKNHPELQNYLQEHPAIREEIKENPNAFMRREERFDRREDDRDRDPKRRDSDTTRQELARFDQFLENHREIAEQLRRDPSLVNNEEYVKNHPELQSYLQEHPAIREEIKENPNSFMKAENRFDRREDNRDRDANRDVDRDRDANRDRDADRDRNANRERDVDRDRDAKREELARFDRFLDSHRETAEQVRRNPSLVNNEEFLKNHPALQSFLKDHPGVRDQLRDNPNAFMTEEARYDRREDGLDRDRRGNDLNRDIDRESIHRHFGEFLGGHAEIAQRLSKDPSLVKNQEFIDHNPELKEYLNAHPEARQEMMANPQSFVKSSEQFTNKTPAVQPKPKP